MVRGTTVGSRCPFETARRFRMAIQILDEETEISVLNLARWEENRRGGEGDWRKHGAAGEESENEERRGSRNGGGFGRECRERCTTLENVHAAAPEKKEACRGTNDKRGQRDGTRRNKKKRQRPARHPIRPAEHSQSPVAEAHDVVKQASRHGWRRRQAEDAFGRPLLSAREGPRCLACTARWRETTGAADVCRAYLPFGGRRRIGAASECARCSRGVDVDGGGRRGGARYVVGEKGWRERASRPRERKRKREPDAGTTRRRKKGKKKQTKKKKERRRQEAPRSGGEREVVRETKREEEDRRRRRVVEKGKDKRQTRCTQKPANSRRGERRRGRAASSERRTGALFGSERRKGGEGEAIRRTRTVGGCD